MNNDNNKKTEAEGEMEEHEKKRERKRKKHMPTSGKSVFEIKKLKEKREEDYI